MTRPDLIAWTRQAVESAGLGTFVVAVSVLAVLAANLVLLPLGLTLDRLSGAEAAPLRWVDLAVPSLAALVFAPPLAFLGAVGVRRLARSEAGLRDSEMRFRGLIEGSIQGILIHRDFKPLYANDACARIWGLGSGAEVMQLPSFVPFIPPHLRDPARENYRRLMSGELKGTRLGCENLRLDGQTVWIEVMDKVVEWMGEPAILVTMVDQTDQVRSARTEALLRQAIDQLPASFVIYGPDERMIFFNEPFRRDAPYAGPAEAMIGRTIEEVLRRCAEDGVVADPVLREDPEAWLRKALENWRQADESSYQLRNADGRWYMLRSHRMPSGHTLVAHWDITDQKRHELEMQEARDRLTHQAEELRQLAGDLERARAEAVSARRRAEQANASKSRFLANMSHELRTPLNAIIGFSEVIKDQLFGPAGVPRYVEYARDVHGAGIHLLALIDDILDLAKIEAGRLDIKMEQVELAELMDASVRLMEQTARDHGLDLVTRLPDDLPPLSADRRAAVQMLLNLLSNAVKFTPRGGTVTVSAARAEDGGIDLSVADTGIGIAPQHLDHVFEPFAQVSGPIARRHKGTGLGLSLVRHLIGLHGGTARISSAVGRGTTIVLHFPPANPEAPAGIRPPRAAVGEEGGTAKGTEPPSGRLETAAAGYDLRAAPQSGPPPSP
jgi:two-component system, cell cycle sensor histidine kinase PleC